MNSRVDLQRVWDDAALLAHRGQPLEEVVSRLEDTISPDVNQAVLTAVPAHGRAFWVSMGKSVAAAVLIIALLLFMKSFARPLPGLTATLCGIIGVAAVAVGLMAGRQRVRNGRLAVGHAQRASVRRVAEEAARAVWTAEVPGSWSPSGPPLSPAVPAGAVPAAWLRRWGADATTLPAVTITGSLPELRAALSRLRGPGVFFVRGPVPDPDLVTDADRQGLAVFRLAGIGVTPVSATAQAVWAAYRSADTTAPPADLFRQRWQPV